MTKKTKEKKNTDAADQKKEEKIEKPDPEIELQEKIDVLTEELKQQREKLMRCYADFDNYKKRMVKEKQTLLFQTKKNYLLELLDVKEILLKALDDKDPKEGLRIILNQLEQFFESENIKYIDCIEQPFNHELHHAVTTIEKPDVDDNLVIEEVKKGYMVEDKVLRPAHVVVSKKKCEEE